MAINSTAFPPTSNTTITVGKGILVSFTALDLSAALLRIENTLGAEPLHISMIDNQGNQILVDPLYQNIGGVDYIDFNLSGFSPIVGTWKIRLSA